MKKINKKKGFTIIETMIAISLFIVVVMAGMTSLLNANLVSNKSQNMRSIMDNLSFVMEDMSRNLRTGYSYHCITDTSDSSDVTSLVPKSCATGGGISFDSALGAQWVYLISNGVISRSIGGGVFSFIQLTPNEVSINSITSSISVLGAEPPIRNLTPPYSPYYSGGNFQQPLITIRLVGTITYKPGTSSAVVTPFSLQTSVSQRTLDI